MSKLFIEERIVFGRIDGDVHSSKRKTILTEFHDNPDVRILFMTIGIGANGVSEALPSNSLSICPSIKYYAHVHTLAPQQPKQPLRHKPGPHLRASMESLCRRPGNMPGIPHGAEQKGLRRAVRDGEDNRRGMWFHMRRLPTYLRLFNRARVVSNGGRGLRVSSLVSSSRCSSR